MLAFSGALLQLQLTKMDQGGIITLILCTIEFKTLQKMLVPVPPVYKCNTHVDMQFIRMPVCIILYTN